MGYDPLENVIPRDVDIVDADALEVKVGEATWHQFGKKVRDCCHLATKR
jgi:hypothetical protein